MSKTPKTPKVHAMRLKAQVDIQVDPGSDKSLGDARRVKASIAAHVKELGYALVITDYRLLRVPAPKPVPAASEPEPKSEDPGVEPAEDGNSGQPTEAVGDGMDFPEGLDRRGEAASERGAAE